MSTFDADDLETMGYFLPEDSQLRLKKLREHAEFLSHLAQSRTADEGQERIPEISVGDVAICLELLAEQMGLVLDNLSWPACRFESETASGTGAEPEAAEEIPDDAGGRYIFGVTLEQVDRLNRLIDMITAHGDVVIASDEAEFADHTLSVLGNAIFGDARTVRDIIRQVESQRLGQARGSQTGVGEERAAYRAGRKTWSGLLLVRAQVNPIPFLFKQCLKLRVTSSRSRAIERFPMWKV
ncbi:XAC0095 family protein [Rhodanobacter koreensis]